MPGAAGATNLNGITTGNSHTATLRFTAPSSAGTYTYYLRAVENNGVGGFGEEITLTLAVTESGSQQRDRADDPALHSSFEAWRQANFSVAELADLSISGADAVYGTDGRTNLFKYALGLEPQQDEVGGGGEVFVDESEWTYVYPRPSARSDVNYVVEVSRDGVTWTSDGVTHARDTATAGWEIWKATYPQDGEPVVFRIVVLRR